MNERILELALQASAELVATCPDGTLIQYVTPEMQKFAELIVRDCASEYKKLINGEAVVLPKDREHARSLIRVGMFYLENNK